MVLRRKLAVLGLFWLALIATSSTQAEENTYIALNYHDVKDQLDAKDDSSTISTDKLISHFNWLQKHGYTAIDLDDVVAAQQGKQSLPAKAVMLTFDDGYASFYNRVFPLLKAFKFKAVQAVIGKWIEEGECNQSSQIKADATQKGTCTKSPADVMTWEQLKEISQSGLVEIASHTYDLHHGISANPQADQLPAATSYAYDATSKNYENDDSYHKRIYQDLMQNNTLLKEHLGKAPRIVVWPYGSHHSEAIAIAKEAGMPYNMLLSDSEGNTPEHSSMIRRNLILKNMDIDEFTSIMEGPSKNTPVRPQRIRVMHVDLDYLYDPNPVQEQKNLDSLIERVHQMGANTVYLQAFSDSDGDGAADALYFPNRYMPVREDLFSHIAWRLRTRLHVKVYAWMPVLAFHMADKYHLPIVKAVSEDKKGTYHRLTPFNGDVRTVVRNLYEDLSKHARFNGIIFHDDATLNDYEDASEDAMKTYNSWGFNKSIPELRVDPSKKKEWARKKTEYLTNFTLELAASTQRYQEVGMKTARNIYALPVLNPDSEEWFAQSLESFLKAYSYTAIMAMPYMESVPREEHEAWLMQIAARVKAVPGALEHSVFELQSVDWKTKQPLPSEILANQMFILQKNAVLNLGYYPDDFPANRPAVSVIRRYFATED